MNVRPNPCGESIEQLFMLFQLHLENSEDKSVMSFDIGGSIQVRFTMLAGALFDVTSGSRV